MSDDPILTFSEMLALDQASRAEQQLRVLDALFARAVKDGKYPEALKIMAEAREVLARSSRR